uniref:Reverse transcriptase zinc-binding domain-containing protein n=1 Tax=Opuntia streptacantha TaxID=393608 RepID=A0A7C9CXT7_OPUST
MVTLCNHNPQQNKEDTLLWNEKNQFTVKMFQQECNKGAVYDSLVCKVWMNLAPPRVEFFMWLALLDKINTKELLWRKGVLQEDQLKCTFCSAQVESTSHLLVLCPVSWTVWSTVAEDLKQELQLVESFRMHYEVWMGRNWRNATFRKLWCTTFFAVAWSLWLARNEIIFQQKEMDLKMLCNLIRWRVAYWTKAWKEKLPYSCSDLARKFDIIPDLFN